jgi:PAS domain S-box-containing protein
MSLLIREVFRNGGKQEQMVIFKNFICQLQVTPYRTMNGEIAGAVILFSDMTSLYTAKMQVEQGKEQLQNLIDNIFDAVITINQAGRILSFSSRAEEMFGHQAYEVLGKNFGLLISGQKDGKDFLNDLKNGQGKSGRRREEEGRRKDGTVFPIEISANEMTSDGEHIFSALLRDITERKHAEKEKNNLEVQLRHAQKLEAIGQLAAGIAHEINTPTQYVGDNTYFLQQAFKDLDQVLKAYQEVVRAAQDGRPSPEILAHIETRKTHVSYLLEEIPSAITQSLEGIKRISNIVRAMKDFSHPGREEKVDVDLNQAIQSTITVCRNEWKYVAEMETDFDPDLPRVSCLPGEINQVILNLVINGAHAISDVLKKDGGSKGKIRITTRRDGDRVEIRIQDTGAGIPEEVRPRIFEPFFTTKEVGKGTGQGLSICHTAIVRNHGGTIDFESEVGKGTTFIVRIPMTSADPLKAKEMHEITDSVRR